MPLEFESLSHGRIAFGFFNIETDMILLDRYFLFAQDFCSNIAQAAKEDHLPYQASWEIYLIERSVDIGNLMGAIYGIEFRGFIGEVYELFPFPKRQEDFKQKPESFQTRTLIESLIQKYSSTVAIQFAIDRKSEIITIGDYLFEKLSFHRLIQYIWMGGFPRWKDKIRPGYVRTMKEKIEESKNPVFKGYHLTP